MNKMIWHRNTGHGQGQLLLAGPAFSRMALDELISGHPYQYQWSHFFPWKEIKNFFYFFLSVERNKKIDLLNPNLENTSKENI